MAPAAIGLWGELRERGYSPAHVRTRMRLMLELSRWMHERGVGLAELNAGMLETLTADARAERQREGDGPRAGATRRRRSGTCWRICGSSGSSSRRWCPSRRSSI